MNCWFCSSVLIWNSDFTFEDYGLEGEGIVCILTCSDCGATFEGYKNDEKLEIEMTDI